jgi:uncharacterized membrane protein
MERIQLAIGRLLLIGVLVSFVFVFIGGSLYLFRNGTDIVHYQSFHGEPKIYKSITDIFTDVLSLLPLALIQFGLLTLVIVQILRVGLTTWLFIQSHDKLFIYISLFIMLVLLYSLIWQF